MSITSCSINSYVLVMDELIIFNQLIHISEWYVPIASHGGDDYDDHLNWLQVSLENRLEYLSVCYCSHTVSGFNSFHLDSGNRWLTTQTAQWIMQFRFLVFELCLHLCSPAHIALSQMADCLIPDVNTSILAQVHYYCYTLILFITTVHLQWVELYMYKGEGRESWCISYSNKIKTIDSAYLMDISKCLIHSLTIHHHSLDQQPYQY